MVMNTEDIMAEFKSARFVVVSPDLGFDPGLVVLSDLEFWIDRLGDLETWCQLHGAVRKGPTVEIPSDEILTLFALKWS